VVTRTASGACGASGSGAPHGVNQIRMLPASPVLPPHGPKVLEVSNPPQAIANVPPHA
jgi:hypothetical protein